MFFFFEIAKLYNKIIKTSNIYNTITISNFLNLADKEADKEKDRHTIRKDKILQEVLQKYLGTQYTQNDNKEEKQSVELYVHSAVNTKQALQVLIKFIKCQESLSTKDLQILEQIESKIDRIREASIVQGTLDS